MSDYENIRLKNLEDNRRILASFGLSDPFKSLPRVIKKSNKFVCKPLTLKAESRSSEADSGFVGGSVYGTRRQSARLKESVGSEVSYAEVGETDSEDKRRFKVPSNRPNFYGEVAGVEVGTVWSTRLECCSDGIHRPTVAGIHGGENGAYSIALSGGYEDDVDLGDCFTYTGEGGRDLKGTKTNPKNLRTAPQSREQTLTRGNLGLSKNVETKNPVRVIRGYKLDSPFAPEEGYRYDGLYTVEKCWFTTGLSGFGVWKFALKRCNDQAPPPWQFSTDLNVSEQSTSCPVSDSHETNSTSNGQLSTNFLMDHCGNSKENIASDVEHAAKADHEKKNVNVGDKDSKQVLREISADCSLAEPARKRICRKK